MGLSLHLRRAGEGGPGTFGDGSGGNVGSVTGACFPGSEMIFKSQRLVMWPCVCSRFFGTLGVIHHPEPDAVGPEREGWVIREQSMV